MTAVKVDGGYKIRLESGKLLPKIYPSKDAANKRIRQMKSFKEKLVFEVQDFSTEVIEKEEKGSKIKGLRLFGTALKEGISRNKRNYTIDNLKENNGEEFNFIVAHRNDYDNPDHNAGEGTYSLNGNVLEFDGKIYDNHHHPDITEQVQKGLVAVSVQGGYQDVKVKENKVVFEGLRIPILALVNKHTRGVEAASIETAIAEKLELNECEEVKMSEDFTKVLKEKEDKIKEQEDSMKELQERFDKLESTDKKRKLKAEEDEKGVKKKLTESLIKINKEFKEEELMKKSLSELEMMEKYETKIKESEDGEGEEQSS